MKKYIVVGGGVLGASTAYHLAKEGVEVKVIDRKDAEQATEAAAGIVCPWLAQRRNKRWYRLVKGGARYYPELIRQLEAEGESKTGYRRVGAISLQRDEQKLEKTMERALKRREDGAPEIGEITRISPEEAKKLFPPLADGYDAIHVSGAARVNGRELRDALLRVAAKNGVEQIHGEATLVYEGKKVTAVEVDGVLHEADEVIVTAGAWAKPLLKLLGINFLVHPQKAQIVHLDLPDTETENWPVIMPPNNQYMLSFGGGRVVIGATHETDAGFDGRSTAGGLHYVFDKALEVAPGLYESTFAETRVGFRPFTPGSLPVFGRVPEWGNLYVANGLGASGLTSGPYVGAEVARLVLGKETELDPADYDVMEAIEPE
ncbi:NAD(P)/FAD-dependent oxidoreductase [Halobacillus karajensis]|uniref:Hydrogen cyanide synthase subunit HcnC n=1 Tax=Halobacillus karajensis TaxID=195088 RepID=A0A024PAB3_9BACI|nr:FAD-dependent oxidoreductase [Halobacillus karajensis]CDQ21427.1 Hydrogen cyanide synthase subunit HcnC precursor [Halobacillus karajensis]CDQ25362.1 Hydrogen cyanide synthase subunit HcnC precursor [Halobacillus karajensis]CDQ29686.1 Hydrogen cyanide synthase subunit HcnC precursor [Halobacillus karajensis]